jgi:hypothetical protein
MNDIDTMINTVAADNLEALEQTIPHLSEEELSMEIKDQLDLLDKKQLQKTLKFILKFEEAAIDYEKRRV